MVGELVAILEASGRLASGIQFSTNVHDIVAAMDEETAKEQQRWRREVVAAVNEKIESAVNNNLGCTPFLEHGENMKEYDTVRF
ncbi:MAG: hypothetical protein SGARI_003149, partial [Bacillariaceae sp.]